MSKNVRFSFYLLPFFFYKIREQEGRIGPALGRQVGRYFLWEGEVARKRGRRVTTVQNMCAHVCKCKNDSC
jgi:hypothetical protein